MGSKPVAAAHEMREVILAHRNETEAERRLARPIVEALIESRLSRMALPEDLGGLATPVDEGLEVYETLAAAEASVPWVVWNVALTCCMGRFMEDTARKTVFSDPRWLYAQSTRPTGSAVLEGDTYRVRGRWSLVSGCELADWLCLLCTIEQARGGDGSPETRFLFLPRGEFQILDTWHVGGLRGTGSHDVVVEDARVPRELSASPGDPNRLTVHAIGRVPIFASLVAAFAAQALGVAQASVEALTELARTKTGEEGALRDRPAAQVGVASAATALEAARNHLREQTSRLWQTAVAGREPVLAEQSAVFSAAIHAVGAARAGVDAMYALGGTSSLYVDCPLERQHRDLNAMLRHIAAQEIWMQDAGRVRLGLEPVQPLFRI